METESCLHSDDHHNPIPESIYGSDKGHGLDEDDEFETFVDDDSGSEAPKDDLDADTYNYPELMQIEEDIEEIVSGFRVEGQICHPAVRDDHFLN